MVGGDYIPKNLRLLRVDGRMVFINTMKGNKAEGVDFGLIMKNRLTITGSTLRNRDVAFKAALTKEILAKCLAATWKMENSNQLFIVNFHWKKLQKHMN